jgi:hypothetical protein
MFEEKLKEAILGELKRQAANRPEALKVEGSTGELIVNGKIDLAELVMAIAGSVAGGHSYRSAFSFSASTGAALFWSLSKYT